MRASFPIIAIVTSLASIGPARSSESSDAEVKAWSMAFASWVDVSRNIGCSSLKPRIDALTKRLGEVQDVFLSRHPDYVFPPMVYATHPFIGCDEGAPMIARAETLAGQVEGMVKRQQ